MIPVIHHEDTEVTVWHGNCLDVLHTLPDASVDSVVTDPPYGLGFMGKEWDDLPPGEPLMRECLRVLKPGGHMLAFGGTRTWHRLAVAAEDAGFEIRDSLAWLYGSGFPKSRNISLDMDRMAGAESEVVGTRRGGSALKMGGDNPRPWHERQAERGGEYDVTAPASDDAKTWEGWGTALKPAFEPIVMARKPLEGTVAGNVLTHGTGALNIDGCRVEHADAADLAASLAKNPGRDDTVTSDVYGAGRGQQSVNEAGRWPANAILDEPQACELDAQSGASVSRIGKPRGAAAGDGWGMTATGAEYDDAGGASRFFFVAKAPKKERPRVNGVAHPTVKPLALMAWLIRLVTPPGGIVLEPFAGSGTTIEAAIREGFRIVAIEREADYLPLIDFRIKRRGIIPADPPRPRPEVADDFIGFDFLHEGAS